MTNTRVVRTVLVAVLLVAVGASSGQAAKLTTIFEFQGGSAGSFPSNASAPLAVGPQGQLRFTANGTVMQLSPPKPGKRRWKAEVLYTPSAGRMAMVIAGPGGSLYGTAEGFASNCGATLRLDPPTQGQTTWTPQVLHEFAGDADGCLPLGGVTLGGDGWLYGTTLTGGGSFTCGSDNGVPTGCGIVYALKPAPSPDPWPIQAQPYDGQNGAFPYDAPVEDPQAAGVFYDSTNLGGAPSGDETSSTPGGEDEFKRVGKRLGVPSPVVAWYKYIGDVAYPQASPTPVPTTKPPSESLVTTTAPVSVLIGTSTGGGVQSSICEVFGNGGCGSVYRLTRPAAGALHWGVSVLHEFSGASDGANPTGRLLLLADGELYGTTTGGEVSTDMGTIFRLVPDSARHSGYRYEVVHRFSGTDGATPTGQLTLVGGVLYGITSAGGTGTACVGGCGTVFALTP